MKPRNAKPGPRAAARVAVKLPPGGREGPVPVLPDGDAFTEATRNWWQVMWRSPVAAAWDDAADVPALARLAAVRNRAEVEGHWSRTLASEARLLEDRFGLSPLARARLGWVVAAEPEVVPELAAGDGARWLRALDP